METLMQRRQFLAGLTLLPALPLMAYADDSELTIGIYPGTGKADIFMDEFRAAAMPFAQALAASLGGGLEPKLTLFRTIKPRLNPWKRGGWICILSHRLLQFRCWTVVTPLLRG